VKRRKREAARFETFRIPALRVPELDPTTGALDPEDRELSELPMGPESRVTDRGPVSGIEPSSLEPELDSAFPTTLPAPSSAVLAEYSVTERAPPPWHHASEEEIDTWGPEEWIDEDPSDV
jgi:hypothetical protein